MGGTRFAKNFLFKIITGFVFMCGLLTCTQNDNNTAIIYCQPELLELGLTSRS